MLIYENIWGRVRGALVLSGENWGFRLIVKHNLPKVNRSFFSVRSIALPVAVGGENLRAFSFPVCLFFFRFSPFSLELLEISRGLFKRPWKALPKRRASLGLSLFQEHIRLTIWGQGHL